jgi:hypothetical protein
LHVGVINKESRQTNFNLEKLPLKLIIAA